MMQTIKVVGYSGKMHSSVLILLLVVSYLSSVSSKWIENAKSEEPESERIIRGVPAYPGQFPWTAALYFNDQFLCTSSIISPTTLLTAAHCMEVDGVDLPIELYYAIANVNRSAPSVRIEFESVRKHPDYNPVVFDNDLAVLKTIEPIKFSSTVRPICIARPNTKPMLNKIATAMGWGDTDPSDNRQNIPDILQYTKQVLVNNRLCSNLMLAANENKICATGGVTGICNGDSGGPLVSTGLLQRPVQIGIASYFNNEAGGCGRLYPAVFTRVSSYYRFIMETANDSSICSR